jgi:hypothetical protein
MERNPAEIMSRPEQAARPIDLTEEEVRAASEGRSEEVLKPKREE